MFRHNLLLCLRWRQQNSACPLHCTAFQASYLHHFQWIQLAQDTVKTLSGSTKGDEFVGQLDTCQLLKKVSAI